MTTRPNTTGTRGGQATSRPLPLAERDGYSKDNEQAFRTQLAEELRALRTEIATRVKARDIAPLLHALAGGI